MSNSLGIQGFHQENLCSLGSSSLQKEKFEPISFHTNGAEKISEIALQNTFWSSVN